MRIDKNNYEQYLVDYLDGKLTPVEVSEVLLFLEQNPEIKAEFEGVTGISVKADPEETSDFSSLKKPAYAEVRHAYENMLVAELEGDLTTEEQIILKQAKQVYPELEQDAALFKHTVIIPEQIVFEHKKELKKPVFVPLYRQTWLSVAAALLMVSLSAVLWFGNHPASTNSGQAMNTATGPSAEEQKNGEENVGKATGTKEIPEAIAQNDRVGEQSSVNVQPEIRNAIVSKAAVSTHYIRQESILPKAPSFVDEGIAFTAPRLPYVSNYLNYPASIQQPTPENYTDVKELALQQIEKKKEQLLGKNEDGKTLTLLQALNKATGDNVKVDTNEAGRVTRFEIAGLGFEWSHSK